jgi:aspartyl-tRNA(Asn)/glutamyl-tRNA(Gln) amidotransferase subunit A
MSWDPIATIAESVRSGKQSATALVERSIQTMKEQADYNAIITVADKAAVTQAQLIDSQVKDGQDPGPLAGVPFIAKDNFLTRDIETTAASNILRGYIPPISATAVERLESAGAIMVGKANLDAFAHGSSTENSDYGPTLNPHDKTRVPGGSSGGSAAAVALDMAPFALGTDTGGSIRLPASFCGVVGYKPTYGLVSRYGVVAMASSTDVIGPLTTRVADAGLVLDVMAGPDRRDGTTIPRDKSYLPMKTSLKGLKVGVVREYFADGLSSEVRSTMEQRQRDLELAGAKLIDISIPLVEAALAVYYIVVPAEVSSNLNRYDGIRYGQRKTGDSLREIYELTRSYGFNAENKRRIMIGTHVLSSGYYDAYYKRAQTVRTKLIQEFDQALKQVDVLLAPTSPTVAFPLGQNTQDPLAMYLADIMTVAVNLVGVPAINIPAGTANQLPIGLQLIGKQRSDHQLLNVAAAVEAEFSNA